MFKHAHFSAVVGVLRACSVLIVLYYHIINLQLAVASNRLL